MATLGIHLVWTTYMTWPPGDERGHWGPLFDLYGQIQARGGRLHMPDPITRGRATDLAKEPPKFLCADEALVVAGAIGKLVRAAPESTGADAPLAWTAAVEPNHVHLLLGPVDERISNCIGRLKGTSSSDVLKMTVNKGRRRVWTEGYWKVFLFDELAVAMVKEYIEAHNVRRGLPRNPFGWISTCPYSPRLAGGKRDTPSD